MNDNQEDELIDDVRAIREDLANAVHFIEDHGQDEYDEEKELLEQALDSVAKVLRTAGWLDNPDDDDD